MSVNFGASTDVEVLHGIAESHLFQGFVRRVLGVLNSRSVNAIGYSTLASYEEHSWIHIVSCRPDILAAMS
jgi:hypothetical protein